MSWYKPNGTLRSQYPKETRLPFEQIVTYVKQIASALDYAHEQHVIHRDVKPENILLGSNHEIILGDFGIAVVQRTLDSGSMQNPAGTPVYMAPEQIQHKPCAASDQYALGIMVYEWLCGEPPFHGSLFEVWSQHLHKPPPSLRERLPHLPLAVEEAVFRVLAKDPRQRFGSVTDFAMVLSEAFFATQPLPQSRSVGHEVQEEIEFSPLARMRFVPVSSPSEQDHSDEATQPRRQHAHANWEKTLDKRDTLSFHNRDQIIYLERVRKRYGSIRLPLGPAEGLSLQAVFQPLKLRSDPQTVESLGPKQRRPLLGEHTMDDSTPLKFDSPSRVLREVADSSPTATFPRRSV